MELLGLLLVVLGIGFFTLMAVVFRLVQICEPNEVLIIAGPRKRVKVLRAPEDATVGARASSLGVPAPHVPSSREVGYRSVRGGRAIRIPLLEQVFRLDLTNMIIDLSVSEAYSKGGIPLVVKGVANVKIAGEEPLLSNAVERFLGMPRDYVMFVAKEILEGNLRGVLSQMTPQQVNDDKVAFAQNLQKEANDDLTKLGLVLDTLKIQNVSDRVGYLDSIGRRSNADLQRRARISEAQAQAAAKIQDSENRRATFEKQIQAKMATVKAEATTKTTEWETASHALQAEAQGQVKAILDEARAQIEVEKAALRRLRQKLEADMLVPARALRARLTEEARARAAKTIEDGRATAAALQEVSAVWSRLGDDASRVFLLQNLEKLVEVMLRPLGDLHVNRVTVLGEGESATPPTSSVGARALELREELRSTLGVDLQKMLQKLEG